MIKIDLLECPGVLSLWKKENKKNSSVKHTFSIQKKNHFPVFPSLSLASPFPVFFLFFSDHTFPSSAFLFKPHVFSEGSANWSYYIQRGRFGPLVSVLKMTLIL